MHFAEARRHHRLRPVGGEAQAEHRRADNVERGRDRRGIEDRRALIIGALVARHLRPQPDRAIFAAGEAAVLRRSHRYAGAEIAGLGAKGSTGPGGQSEPAFARLPPAVEADPAAGAILIPAARPHRIHDIDAQPRLGLDLGVDVLQPTIPPPQRFLQEADRAAGHREMRIFVRPRAQGWPCAGPSIRRACGPRHFVGVAPAADRKVRSLNVGNPRRSSHASSRRRGSDARATPPARNGSCLQALEPLLRANVRADHQRVRRPRASRTAWCAPHPSFSVSNSRPCSGCRRHSGRRWSKCDHRSEAGRLPGRDLQRVEPAPGDAHHPDPPVAPGLRRAQAITRRRRPAPAAVFVLHDPVSRRCRACRPGRRIAMAGEVGVGQRIPATVPSRLR